MDKKTFSFLTFAIWFICLISLLGIKLYKNNKPRPADFMAKGTAVFQSLNEEEKTNVARHDTAIIRLNDESFHLIGLGYEGEENVLISENRISIKKIDFRIADPILLERRSMVSEAIRGLNNAEKKCLQDYFASVVYKNGDYYLVFDPGRYAEYAIKYGTECKECKEPARSNIKE